MPLDPRGLNCPLPALRTRKMLSQLAYGDRLSVKCIDPLAVIDIPHRLRETGDTLERREASFLYSMSSAEKHGSNFFARGPPMRRDPGAAIPALSWKSHSIPHLIFAFSLGFVAGFAATIYGNIYRASPLMGFPGSCPASPFPLNAFLSSAIL